MDNSVILKARIFLPDVISIVHVHCLDTDVKSEYKVLHPILLGAVKKAIECHFGPNNPNMPDERNYIAHMIHNVPTLKIAEFAAENNFTISYRIYNESLYNPNQFTRTSN